jgi:hypothetical protein
VTAADRLDVIEARANAASPGPWVRDGFGDEDGPRFIGAPTTEQIVVDEVSGSVDAVFIAAARQDVPDLVAALRAVLALTDGPSPWLHFESVRHAIDSGLGGAA